jgi:hypothetical protein
MVSLIYSAQGKNLRCAAGARGFVFLLSVVFA